MGIFIQSCAVIIGQCVCIPVSYTHLDVYKRQGQLPGKGSRDSDFFMLESDGEACQQLVCDLVCRRLPQSYGFDPFEDIQVLCPSKIGPLGTVALNAALQQRLRCV